MIILIISLVKALVSLAIFIKAHYKPRRRLSQTELIFIGPDKLDVYKNLAQAYEAEFSYLTHKLPQANGLFTLDTLPVSPYIGYLLYKKTMPVGFCVANVKGPINDMAEFYIVPSMRAQGWGQILATTLFDRFKGSWQVRELEGAKQAIGFWRQVIGEYSHQNYIEARVADKDWGSVVRQSFQSR